MEQKLISQRVSLPNLASAYLAMQECEHVLLKKECLEKNSGRPYQPEFFHTLIAVKDILEGNGFECDRERLKVDRVDTVEGRAYSGKISYAFSKGETEYRIDVQFSGEVETEVSSKTKTFIAGGSKHDYEQVSQKEIHRFWGEYSFLLSTGDKMQEVDKSDFLRLIPQPDARVKKVMQKLDRRRVDMYMRSQVKGLLEGDRE